MYNLICASSFILMSVLSSLLSKTKKSELILRILSILIFVYKLIHYIIENINGNLAIPVEISNISYFLMSIILVFKIKSLYSIGAFYGIMAGLGYFLFYTFFGFTMTNNFTIKSILEGCFNHGYLLVSGLYLFKTSKFEDKDKLKIWATIFAMLSWSLVFYDMQLRGVTFIYYIIKPKFLFIFENMSLNVLLMMVYYALLVTAFYFVIKLFFKLNNKQKENQNLKNNKRIYRLKNFMLYLVKGINMKEKKLVIYNDKVSPVVAKTIIVKYKFPKTDDYIKLFESVGWERTKKRIKENKKHTTFAVSLYIDKNIVGMGRVVGDGSYFTIYDIVVDKDYQGYGFGSVIMNEIVNWYKTIKDDDTFLYLNASKDREQFYEKFGFQTRPNEDVGAGMKWYEKNDDKTMIALVK